MSMTNETLPEDLLQAFLGSNYVQSLASFIDGDMATNVRECQVGNLEFISCIAPCLMNNMNLLVRNDEMDQLLLDRNGLVDWNQYSLPEDFSGCIDFVRSLAYKAERYEIDRMLQFDDYVLALPFGRSLMIALGDILYGDENAMYTATSFWLVSLECRLYDMYTYRHAQITKSSDIQFKSTSLTLILRDLLASSYFETVLPYSLTKVLRTFFSVRGVNIRNLIWHGFLSPSQLSRGWGKLIILIALNLSPSYLSHEKEEELFSSAACSNLQCAELYSGSNRSRISPVIPVSRPNEDLLSTNLQHSSFKVLMNQNSNLHHASALYSSSSPSKGQSSNLGPIRGEGIDFCSIKDFISASNQNLKLDSILVQNSKFCSLQEEKSIMNSNRGQTTPEYLPHTPLQNLNEYDNLFTSEGNSVLRELSSFIYIHKCANQVFELLSGTLFLPPGRREMLGTVLRYLEFDRGLMFSLATIPILEQGLRGVFAVCNNVPEHFFALPNRYYSTLDGYGQKAKHQLLLDPLVENNPFKPNRLPNILGEGLFGVLTDLFLLDDGPGLRGKFAHGEIDLSDVYATNETNLSIQLLQVAIISIGWKFSPRRLSSLDEFDKRVFTFLEECVQFCDTYRSHCHPHVLLEIDFSKCNESLMKLCTEIQKRTICIEEESFIHVRENSNSNVLAIIRTHGSQRPPINVQIKDKHLNLLKSQIYASLLEILREKNNNFEETFRTQKFAQFFWNQISGDDMGVKVKGQKGVLCGNLMLQKGMKGSNSEYFYSNDRMNEKKELFKNLMFREGTNISNSEEFLKTEQFLWRIPVILTAGPFPHISCLRSILDTANLALSSALTHLLALEQLIITRKATSGQRCNFVTLLQSMPLFVEVISFAMRIVEKYCRGYKIMSVHTGKLDDFSSNFLDERSIQVAGEEFWNFIPNHERLHLQKLNCMLGTFSTCVVPSLQGRKKSFEMAFQEIIGGHDLLE